MKKTLLLLMALSISSVVFAKKVKFSVDMSAEVVSANGVHIAGDFQVAAGYPNNFDPATTELTQEGTTDIYSIEVNIPAGKKYEYYFVNGDLSYEVEYIPDYSRLNDSLANRWIFIDSLDNGTTDIGAIVFGTNAPAGKFLLRFRVDMTDQLPIDLTNKNNRPHVEGSFQNWSPTATALYAGNDSVYEYIAYVPAGTYQFKYVNGNTSGKVETVPSTCATNGNRSVVVSDHIVLDKVCFASCSACVPNGITELTRAKQLNVAPNPSSDFTVLKFNDASVNHTIQIFDITGKMVRVYENYNKAELRIEREQLHSGIYFINSVDSNKNVTASKWIVQ
jgi:alpha-amylase